jgi:sulfite reductase (NADPH) flavoprotein alpha-component
VWLVIAPLDPTDTMVNPQAMNAATVIEQIASRAEASSTVFVYDLAEHVGFGLQTLAWAKEDAKATSAVALQTRDGAGLGLIGRLSQGTSKSVSCGSTVTAYTTPAGLATIAPALCHLPEPSPDGRLVIQVRFTSLLSLLRPC